MTGRLPRALSKLKHRLRPWYHRGGSLRCPVCEHAVRGFDPLSCSFLNLWAKHGYDLDPGRNETLNLDSYQCPLCTVSDRDRLYALYFEKVATQFRDGTPRCFVEFAPIGALSQKLRRTLGSSWEYRTADLFMPCVDDRVDLCDMHAVYADASVDCFLCSHVLEHVPDDRQALHELFRILRPGGWGVLMVPIHLDLERTREDCSPLSEAERWKRFGQGDHMRIHAKRDFEARVEEAGFKLERLGVDDFGADAFARHGIHQRSVLYVGHKLQCGDTHAKRGDAKTAGPCSS
jgi:Methyltransferase domain